MKELNESDKPKANGLREILESVFCKNGQAWRIDTLEKQITSHFKKKYAKRLLRKDEIEDLICRIPELGEEVFIGDGYYAPSVIAKAISEAQKRKEDGL